MNRDILFRGKRVDNGEWVCGYLVSVNDFSRATIFVPHSPEESRFATMPISVVPDTVGQYTGLTDKNGVKIFEGDIVLKRTYHRKEPFSVKFDGGMFYAGIGGGSSTATHRYTLEDRQIEVIGNIYDKGEG